MLSFYGIEVKLPTAPKTKQNAQTFVMPTYRAPRNAEQNKHFIIMNEFEKIISFESLYKAHRRARLGKRWKKEVIEFEMHLAENLWALHYDLKYGRYQVGEYHKFMIYDPKEREIQAISYRDRIVQHSLCDNYLIPLLEKRLNYDNCACRKGKGTNFAFQRFRLFLAEYYKKYGNQGYFVKMDVKKYFPSIDHEILLKKVSRIVRDNEIMDLIKKIVYSYHREEGKGLPMGNQTSQCFALLYLDEIDRMIKEKYQMKYYLRYMDDMICIVREKEQGNCLLHAVSTKLSENRLSLNPKSYCFPLKNGINFLGWRFFLSPTGGIIQKVKKDTKKRIECRIKRTCRSIHTGQIPKERIPIISVSYRGHLSYGNAYFFYQKVRLVLHAIA